MENPKKRKEVVRSRTAAGKQLNQYAKVRLLGEGPYSKVKLVRDVNSGAFFAMKKYNLFLLKKKNKLLKKENGVPVYTTVAQEVLQEAAILETVQHPHIAALVEILQDTQEEKIYFILEYCEKGDIATWSSSAQKFTLHPELTSAKALARCFLQIAQAVDYLHSRDIVHRDLKPLNILLAADLSPRLIDFGRAVQLASKDQKLRGSEGTYHFMAPEMLSEVFKEGYDGRLCDMWALGVTFFGILFQTLPFYHENLMTLFQQIEKAEYVIPQPHNPDYDCFLPLIKQLLQVDPAHRLTAAELILQLQTLN